MNRKKGKILLLFLVFIISFFNNATVKASSVGDIDDFNDLNGDAQYLSEEYRDNYNFDLEKTGILDTGKDMLNGVANMLFQMIKFITLIVVSIFYFAMDFDIGDIFSGQLTAIQTALNKSIFQPLFLLAFVGVSIILLKKMAKRDLIGALSESAKVILLILISYLVVAHSADVLSYGTNVTKSVSVNAITGINGYKSTDSYAGDVSGVLWVNLVHDPWVSLEFGNSVGSQAVSDETINKFLTAKPGTDKRKDLVKKYMEDNPDFTNFNKENAGSQIPFLIVYFIPFIIKCGIYLAVSLIQLLFQFMAVFWLVLAPVILILAMLPGYDLDIVSIWLKKLFETQLGILIITFVMGLLIKFDSLLYTLVPNYGWLIVIILQTVIGVGMVMGRKGIFKAFAGLQKGVSNAGYAKSRIRRSGNIYDKIEKRIPTSSNKRSMNANKTQNTDGDKVDFSMNKGKGKNDDDLTNQNQKPRPRISTDIDFGNPPDIKKQRRSTSATGMDEKESDNPNVVNFSNYKKDREMNRPRLYPTSNTTNNESNRNIVTDKRNYQKVRSAPAQLDRLKIKHDKQVEKSEINRDEINPRQKATIKRPKISENNYVKESGSNNYVTNQNASKTALKRPKVSTSGVNVHRDNKKPYLSTYERPNMSVESPKRNKEGINSETTNLRPALNQKDSINKNSARPNSVSQNTPIKVKDFQSFRNTKYTEPQKAERKINTEVLNNQKHSTSGQIRDTEKTVERPKTSLEVKSNQGENKKPERTINKAQERDREQNLSVNSTENIPVKKPQSRPKIRTDIEKSSNEIKENVPAKTRKIKTDGSTSRERKQTTRKAAK